MPWYGCGYGCWPYSCGSWYGGYYGCGSSVCYAPYPVYYSSVIYDAYSPPAPEPEVVYVEQPAAPVAEAAEAPAAMGEGSVQVAAPGQEGSGVSGRGGAQSAASQRLSQGDEAFREGRYSDAVHDYAKAVELEPREGVLHLILSDALFATGDYHYAAYALRRALELDPTLVDSVIDKHSFYGDPTEFDRQLQLLESYLEDHFLDDDARLLLAANYLFGAKPAQATDLLQSPFSQTMRETAAGKVLLARTNKLLHEPPPAVEAPK
jgi:tetratricopeptide (TPR) repeat protein